ncbi:hypothetical protein O6H91_13G078600 [Diphasiastrum complanatum]|uniref:Uncharacterized protein n=1 Tax=Diphasiastrum complanatum TaxID=34168 RepID=A0ACC2BWF2_DIPCM|nr:hypothetical protein O6H91_13G078600 [Diphasiastrum complanatum]
MQLLQTMASVSAIFVGSQVWVEDDHLAWMEADIQEINRVEVKALTRKGNLVCAPIQNVHLRDRDAKPGGVDDMAKLAYLHEPGVLHNLASRYMLDEIYVSYFHFKYFGFLFSPIGSLILERFLKFFGIIFDVLIIV